MAQIWRTVTGTFSVTGVKKATNTATQASTYDYQSSGYVGTAKNNGTNTSYALFCRPNEGDIFSVSDTAEILSMTMKIRMKRKSTNVSTKATVVFEAWNKAVSWTSAQGMYSMLVEGTNNDTYAHALDITETTTEEREYTITNSEVTRRARKYGFALTMGNAGAFDYWQVLEVSMEATIIDADCPPTISVNNENGAMVDGTYWQDPAEPFVVKIHYTQSADAEMEYFYAEYTNQETGRTESKQTEASTLESGTGPANGTVTASLTFRDDYAGYWKNLPSYGPLKLRVKPVGATTYTEFGYQYRIAAHTITFTSHTSGSIIKNDADAVIAWEATAPTEYSGATEPAKYVVWIWYDDEPRTSGSYYTTKTCTITQAQLAGHTKLHVALTAVYVGVDGVQRCEQDYAAQLDLYIQAATTVGNVTVYNKPWNTPAVRVSWTSTEQKAYQVRVGTYDSGILWGDAQKLNVQKYFAPGEYAVRVRVQGADGEWGDWTTPVPLIVKNGNFVQPEGTQTANELTAVYENGVVHVNALVTVTVSGNNSPWSPENIGRLVFLLYRDDTLLYQAPASIAAQYEDRYACGVHQYKARYLFPESQSYYQTPIVTVDATPEVDGLLFSDGAWFTLPYTDASPRRYAYEDREDIYESRFAGREYPVFARSGQKSQTLSMTYVDMDRKRILALRDHIGETVCYKNTLGERVYGILESVQTRTGQDYGSAEITVRRAELVEEIPYTWNGWN